MMFRKTLALAVIGALTIAAAPKPAAKPPPQAHRAPDAGDPQALIEVLSGLGAKAEVAKREQDTVFLTVTSPTEVFSAQYGGCDKTGRACQAVLFDRRGSGGAPTPPQLNGFNQASMLCRVYQDKGGQAHLAYGALLTPGDAQAGLLMHINAWRGCIGDFQAFLKNPTGFLAEAQ